MKSPGPPSAPRAVATALPSPAPRPSTLPVGPAINTILAVREHAPAEIDELETEIAALHHRLSAAHARKRLLEEMLGVIRNSESRTGSHTPPIAVVR